MENLVPNDIHYINTYDRGFTKLYSCSYKPITQTGAYQISFIYNHLPLTAKPFSVLIRNSHQEKERNKKPNVQGKNNYFLLLSKDLLFI